VHCTADFLATRLAVSACHGGVLGSHATLAGRGVARCRSARIVHVSATDNRYRCILEHEASDLTTVAIRRAVRPPHRQGVSAD
jgi:hypothetical protein